MTPLHSKVPVYILGFMGSGKTTVGRQLAKLLKYDFIDLDKAIEEAANKSIKQIFEEDGEAHFREIEKQQLEKTFTYTATVISCGGGTPCFFDNMHLMNEHGITIYLRMNEKELYSRLKNVKHERPLLAGKTHDELLNFISEKLKEREVFYKKAKHFVKGLDVNVGDIVRLINSDNK